MGERLEREVIRPMEVGDVDAALEIDLLSFPSAWARLSYLRDLVNPNCCYLVVEREGRIIAYAGMWVVKEDSHLTTVAVHPEFRREGLGRRLLEEMIRAALERGAQRMSLEVRPGNFSARRLYESCGFIPVGEIRHYYLDTDDDALVMSLSALRLRKQ